MNTKLFLDTIDLEELKDLSAKITLYGVTTNPTLAKRFGMHDDVDMVKKIHDANKNLEIHVEAFGNTSEEITDNAERINSKCKNINLVFKIPFSEAGTKATKYLIQKKFKTSLHLIYSINQAILAASVNSTYICPLIGRLDDIGHNANLNILEMKNSYLKNNVTTKIMGSSIRNTHHVVECFKSNIDAITIPINVFKQMFIHPLTNSGYKSFESDYKNLSKVSVCKIYKNLIVDENSSTSKLITLLASNKAGAVAIKNKNNKLSGIFTTGDLKRLVAKGINMELQIKNYMSKKPITLDVNDTVDTAIKISKEKKISHFVVIDSDEVCGILETKDLI
jgi:TalC/MipB family fructose-6-phosphate aldolase